MSSPIQARLSPFQPADVSVLATAADARRMSAPAILPTGIANASSSMSSAAAASASASPRDRSDSISSSTPEAPAVIIARDREDPISSAAPVVPNPAPAPTLFTRLCSNISNFLTVIFSKIASLFRNQNAQAPVQAAGDALVPLIHEHEAEQAALQADGDFALATALGEQDAIAARKAAAVAVYFQDMLVAASAFNARMAAIRV